ncbi:MAG: DUF3108 domain-containing protein [candidate division Zixibacteria bacterium]|nr:DUF3108 domain-containing protein [candidate division Zixibacteria bacterium]
MKLFKNNSIVLYCLILLPIIAVAGNFTDNWPDGKNEKLEYEVITYGDKTNKGQNSITLTRTGGEDDIIIVTQHLAINEHVVTIKTNEKYDARTLRLISSENNFYFAPGAKVFYGIDSLVVTAQPDGESLEILASDTIAVSCRIPFYDDLVTGMGAMLLGRSCVFDTGWSRSYRQINLINLTGKPYEVQNVTDSVIGEETISLSIGSYDCYKVMKIMPNILGFSYYAKEEDHLPIMIEAFDRTGMVRLMSIHLTKREE